ncbi:FAD-dependent monooxygenase [Actinoplanes sp. NPDC051633]|uniref:FAD-dependent monooxygenase n=1 Tax=Actinoplanes sp. NPDC051633 TaxID=3155670 RepID=UPI00342C63D5
MDVLISGASIAGPALAYWLGRAGHRPTIVEIAPRLRTGGSAVDFRGPLHLGILERMGVLDALRARQTGGTAMRFEDADGGRLMEMPSDFAGGDLELRRGDLAEVLCEAAAPWTEFIFGDSIASMTETATGVDVTFRSGLRRTFDLVIGADGVHSTVRRLTFGPEDRFVKHLGYYVAGWDMPNEWGAERQCRAFNEPGRLASMFCDGDTAGAFMAFRAPPLEYDRRDLEQQKRIVLDRFAGMGWLTPRLLDGLAETRDMYFDQICRVDVPEWARGRVTLIGDAASGLTIGGQGCGTALIEAYALAGELAAAGGDHRVAFAAYERRFKRFTAAAKRGNPGRFLAPRRGYGIRLRDWLHNRAWFLALTMRMAADRTDLDLPAYSFASASSVRSASDGTTRDDASSAS